jgi:hypothetical protein
VRSDIDLPMELILSFKHNCQRRVLLRYFRTGMRLLLEGYGSVCPVSHPD